MSSGWLPPQLACRFTPSEAAALAVVASQAAKHSRCDLALDHIAALAGVGRTTVCNALAEARRLGLLTVEVRRLRAFRNDTNVVRVASLEGQAWLSMRRSTPGGGERKSVCCTRYKYFFRGEKGAQSERSAYGPSEEAHQFKSENRQRQPLMFYHVNLRFFRDGEVIMPGSYGAAARSYRYGKPVPPGHAAPFAWEVAFETARLCISPMSLSRLDCVFVWQTEEQARQFKERFRPEDRCIFEVEPALDDFRLFRGDYDLIDNRFESYVDFMCRDAVTYWRDPPKGNIETLIGCPVRVIRYVS